MKRLIVGVDIPMPTSTLEVKKYPALPRKVGLGLTAHLSDHMSQQNVYKANRLIGYWVNRCGDFSFEPASIIEAPKLHTCEICEADICEVDTQASIETPNNYSRSHPTLCPSCELQEAEYKLAENAFNV